MVVVPNTIAGTIQPRFSREAQRGNAFRRPQVARRGVDEALIVDTTIKQSPQGYTLIFPNKERRTAILQLKVPIQHATSMQTSKILSISSRTRSKHFITIWFRNLK
jgi:hypothetical protein